MLIFTCFVLISLSWCSTQQPRAKTTSARFAVAPWDVGAPLSIRTRCRRQPRQSLQNKNIAWKNEKTRVIRCHTEDWILSQSVKRIQNQNDSCNVSSVRRESCGLSHGLPYFEKFTLSSFVVDIFDCCNIGLCQYSLGWCRNGTKGGPSATRLATHSPPEAQSEILKSGWLSDQQTSLSACPMRECLNASLGQVTFHRRANEILATTVREVKMSCVRLTASE